MVVLSFANFDHGQFRLARVEGFEGSDNVMMDIVAEQPWNSLQAVLEPYGLTPSEVAWEIALARQRREQDY